VDLTQESLDASAERCSGRWREFQALSLSPPLMVWRILPRPAVSMLCCHDALRPDSPGQEQGAGHFSSTRLMSAKEPKSLPTKRGRILRALFLHTPLRYAQTAVGARALLKCSPGVSPRTSIMFELRLGLPKMRPRRETRPDADAELA
jgi:hypothetical protein